MFVYSVEDSHPTLSAVGEPVDFAGLYRLTGVVILGKGPACDIRVRDERLSERHARFELGSRPTGGPGALPRLSLAEGPITPVVYVQDLSGSSGVYLNGKKIQRAKLEDGDQLRFYSTEEDAAPRGDCGESPRTALPEEPKVVSEPTQVEISRETVPWQPVANLDNFCTDDRGKWVSQTLKLADSGGQTDRAHLRLQVLLSLSAALSRPQKLEEHLSQVAHFVLQTMNLDRSALFLLCTPWKPGEAIVFRHRTQAHRDKEDPNDPSMTIMTKVIQDEEGVLIRDAMVNNDLVASASIKIQKIRTCICLPLKTPRRMLGVLYADAGRPSVLNDKEDVQFFSAFATLAAVAVENNLLLQQVQQEAVTRARFERFFPPNTVETVLGQGGRLEGREQIVTVMFCDIRNYTQMSAQRNPRQVAELLNRYFQTLVPIVFRCAGTLEKYIGDALVAIWGAPLETSPTHQAVCACQAALAIQKAIAELNQKFPDIPLEVGIGLHHGPAYVGTIGDDTYMQYAAIGATTNLSARICSQTPAREVLVSREVALLLHGANPRIMDEMPFPTVPTRIVPRGRFAAKGFAEEVEIFQVAPIS